MRQLVVPAALIAGALALTGCGGSGSGGSKAELSVSASYMPQPVTGDMAAGYFTIANKGGAKDELTSVTSDAAATVTMHETVGQSMEEVTSLDVPAHGQLVFKSGGNHLMFEKLKRKPRQGEKVTVELHFAKSDPITVEMPVKSATYNPATGH
ncbi:copper chaperone PCu(A)C [Streptomyces cylindrosporus]|uniref:Copper chaperone PCu(A)C n=1 Tax=Streptomyces cylindrosporus TaxID=2927583 RepID=A0ABS9YBN5_9ACTN|nr:copper chaperone PCu(A)C [Streptomyces cylindrosporus]MCI3274647.1 copper chaperone PCu(A)C [Streptomyces cylindrosporus]